MDVDHGYLKFILKYYFSLLYNNLAIIPSRSWIVCTNIPGIMLV